MTRFRVHSRRLVRQNIFQHQSVKGDLNAMARLQGVACFHIHYFELAVPIS